MAEQIGEAARNEPRLRLSLDAFEPDRASLAQWVRRRAEDPESARTSRLLRAAEVLERTFGPGATSAVLVAVGGRVPAALERSVETIEALELEGRIEAAGSVEALLGRTFAELVASGPAVLEIGEPDEWPLPTRTLLRDLAASTGGLELIEIVPERDPPPAELPATVAPRLERLVAGLGLCSPAVPVVVLLDLLEVPPRERDALVDELDGLVASHGEALGLADHQYGHPSFPEDLTYGVEDTLKARSLAARLKPAERTEIARWLFDRVERTLDRRSRGTAVLLHRLGQQLDPAAALAPREMLRGWVTRGEVEAWRAGVEERLAAGELTLDTLWRVAELAAPGWPPFRTRAVLDVLGERVQGLDRLHRGRYHLLRARLEHRDGRPDEVYREAASSAECLGAANAAPAGERVDAEALAATSARRGGRPDLAERHWRRALDVVEREETMRGELSAIHRHLADLASARQDWESAIALQERSSEVVDELYGPSSPEAAEVLRVLAGFYRSAGRIEAAIAALERVLAIERTHHGETTEVVSDSLKMLADLRHRQGDETSSWEAQERALAIDRRLFGERDPRLIEPLKVLAGWALKSDTPDAAREYLEEALELERAFRGERGDAGLLQQALDSITGDPGAERTV